jgi:molybdopterin synthase sulfur carrier subunit
MAEVRFTNHLRRFFPDLETVMVEAATVAEVVAALDARYPGLGSFLVDERGALRKHVNIFIGGSLIRDRQTLSDAVPPDGELYVIQALSGG